MDTSRGRTKAAAVVSAGAFALLQFSTSVSASALAQDLQGRHDFKIPAQPLDAALLLFSDQAKIQVLMRSNTHATLSSPGVTGAYPAAKALSIILDKTGFIYQQVDSETVAIVQTGSQEPARTAADQQQQNVVSPPAASMEPAASADGTATASTEAPEDVATVTITGSRIVRQGYTTPTPVTAIDATELADAAHPNIGDTLNELPVFQGSLTNRNQTISDTESAQTELNLRNLGANRTLVLFDGRRLPSSNTEGVPNVDLIPDALIQRVDVVTGGASAVYGSDAVSGVVNYILDTNFTGVKVLAEGGVSGYGDGPSDKISVTLGGSFLNDRLHLIVSGDQSYQGEISGTARSWNTSGRGSMQNPAYTVGSNVPQFISQPCCIATTYPPGGVILGGPLNGTTFGAGGSVGQFNFGLGTGAAGNDFYGGSWQDSSMAGGADILPADTARHVFVRAGFDITDDDQIFFEYLGGANHTEDQCCYDYYQTGIGSIYTSNPFIPSTVLAQAKANNVSSFSVGDSLRFPSDQFQNGGLGVNNYHYQDVYVLGAKGKFKLAKSDWNWNIYGQQGISIEDERIIGESDKANLSNAIQAVRVGSYGPGYTAAQYPNPLGIPAGEITCASNLLPLKAAGETRNCVPYNIFGTGVVSQAAINYTQGDAHMREAEKQTIAGGTLTGAPFNDWAGPVSVAVSAEWRREIANGYNDAISAETGWFSTNYFPFIGSQSVREGALETVVPLWKDLDLNAAARATDYSTSGYVTTWKFGLEWTPIQDIRFRATQSMDIRAPNLSELYGYSNGHGTTVDPFAGNVSVPAYTVTGGNPELKPEKAHQSEFGVVLQPSFLPGFHLSADWWRIRITGAISTLNPEYELQDCFNTRIDNSYSGTSPYCSLITRNSDSSLNSVEIIPFNLASFLAQGIDYQADYRTRLDNLVDKAPGTIQLSLAATQTQKLITDTGIPGPAETLDSVGYSASTTAGSGAPRWAAFASLAYDLDPWRFVWQERFVSSVRAANTYIECSTNCPSVIPAGFQTIGWDQSLPAYFVANVSVQYKFMEGDRGKNVQLFLGVDNLFNKLPPWARTTPGQLFQVNTNSTLYDTLGLYVHAGVRLQL